VQSGVILQGSRQPAVTHAASNFAVVHTCGELLRGCNKPCCSMSACDVDWNFTDMRLHTFRVQFLGGSSLTK
jgi:hypothetical protein